jgi:hypothetical protein
MASEYVECAEQALQRSTFVPSGLTVRAASQNHREVVALSPDPLACCAGMDWRPDRLDPFNYACFLGLMDLVRTTWEATPPNKFVHHTPRPWAI